MKSLLKFVACLFALLSFNSKALVVNGCTIEDYTSCVGVDLSYAYLYEADLSYANLSYADLSYINLSDANMGYTDLSYADLSGADLSYADLSNTDLSFANLTDANLHHTALDEAELFGVDLSTAYVYDPHDIPIFYDANLSTTSFFRAFYNDQTIFPSNFDPVAVGMTYVPLPAGIYLFLSGLVGLGISKIKLRKN